MTVLECRRLLGSSWISGKLGHPKIQVQMPHGLRGFLYDTRGIDAMRRDWHRRTGGPYANALLGPPARQGIRMEESTPTWARSESTPARENEPKEKPKAKKQKPKAKVFGRLGVIHEDVKHEAEPEAEDEPKDEPKDEKHEAEPEAEKLEDTQALGLFFVVLRGVPPLFPKVLGAHCTWGGLGTCGFGNIAFPLSEYIKGSLSLAKFAMRTD